MSASKQYVDQTNELLRERASINALNLQAFKNIQPKDFIPQRPKEREEEDKERNIVINLERNIGESNARLITNSEDIAKAIIQSLINNGELSTFNRYFTVFQKALNNQKIQSLGQFNNIFNNFKNNIVTDISKTGLLPSQEVIESVQNIKSGLELEKIDITDILNLNTAQLTNLFLETTEKDLNKPLKVGDVLEFPSSTNYGDIKEFKIIKLAPISIKNISKPQMIKNMIRYILNAQNKYNRSVYNELRKFKPNVEDVGSPVGIPEPMPEGSGLRNKLMGRGISQKKS